MEILHRPASWFLRAPFESAHYVAVWNTARVYRAPWENFKRYAFMKGDYPYTCRLRTPIGEVSVELFGPHDMLTVNEIFARVDYRVPPTIRTVVDIGSNIGVSALYFLTRNDACRCVLFEPNPEIVGRLRANLAPFEDRYTLEESAVAEFDGTVEFGIEPTGRYGGIGRELERRIEVRCRDINDVLEDVLSESTHVDVLKIDTEGREVSTVQAIRPDLLGRVRMIYFESEYPAPALHPKLFEQSRRLFCERLVLRGA